MWKREKTESMMIAGSPGQTIRERTETDEVQSGSRSVGLRQCLSLNRFTYCLSHVNTVCIGHGGICGLISSLVFRSRKDNIPPKHPER